MPEEMLLLVDGHAVLYRSFFAIKDLRTSSGKPTNAVFGFVRFMEQVRRQWAPSHWAVCFDGGLPQERLSLCADYKAHRPAMPPDLSAQMGLVDDYLDRARICRTRQAGMEADDVLASVAIWAKPKVKRILVATGDKDLYQVADNQIAILGLAGAKQLMGPPEIMEKTGVAPGRMVEWLALTGDSSDNIPGVPGVGPKTAARLVNQYGSVTELWRHIDKIENERLRTALIESRGIVDRNIQMVRLRTDLGSPFELEHMAVREPDPERLLPLYRELEFHSLAAELESGDLFGRV